MKRTLILSTVFVLTAAMFAYAGDITGKVSGVSGTSVVWVDAPAGKTFPAPSKHYLIDQRGLQFQPHIMVVPNGATVDFRNSDNVAHNVFWPSISGDKKLGHNLGTWPQGQSKSYTFTHPGVVSLLCNVHPEMSGFLIVSPSPYFCRDGRFGELHHQGRARRQLQGHCLARRLQAPDQTSFGFGRQSDGRFHSVEMRW
ncbi:MAG: cupredoxin domain-containing protein [Terriglobales bacterium]